MDPLALVSALVAVVALAIAARAYVLLHPDPKNDTSETPAEDLKRAYLEVLSSKVAALETKVADLPSLFTAEVQRVTNQANRAAQALTDLDRRMAPSASGEPSPDDEFEEVDGVLPIDGALSVDPGVQPMPQRLAGTASADIVARYRAVLASRGR